MTHSTSSRNAEILRGLGALLVFAALLAGLPIALYTVAGSPIPDRSPSWDHLSATLMQPDTDHRLFLAAIRVLGWLAWGTFTATVCTETTGYLAGRSGPRLPSPIRPLQMLARDLVATAALVFSTTATVTTPVSAAVHVTADVQPQAPQQPSTKHNAPPARSPDRESLRGDEGPHNTGSEHRTWRTRIIHRGDTLWDLARRAYGSGARYPKIFKASRTLDQPDGIPPLTSPDDLHPGQRVRIPQAPQKTAVPPPARSPHSTNTDGAPEQKRGHTTRPPRTVPTTVPDQPPQAAGPTIAPRTDTPPTNPSTPHGTTEDEPSSAVTLPSGSFIGLGLAAALSLAVAATRLHQRRRNPSASTGDTPPRTASPDPTAKARKAHLDQTYTDHGVPVPSDADLVTQDRITAAPDHISLGTRDHVPVTLPLPGLTLGLTGDGGHAAARALTVELLAKARRDRAEVLIPQPDADVLYPGASLTGIPGLTITPTLTTAITQLEAEILHRARLLETTDQPNLNALRATDRTEPLPTLLLTATIPEPTAATVHAITE
ncbi:LysM peptidoglycan-binding domain-containing protein, partial [Actinomadura sp. KC216]